MRTYAIVNRKGGVGKTTTAVELAFVLATSCRQRVLVIDADSQGNATSTLMGGAVDELEGAGLAEALRYDLEWYPDVIVQTDIQGVDLLPATEGLGDFELECQLGRAEADFNRLRDLLDAIRQDRGYDTVIIDCPPYYSVGCLAALAACDRVIIPAGIDAYSVTGMAGLTRQIVNIAKANPRVRVAGVLLTQWRGNAVAADALAELRESSPVPIFRTVIRRTDKVVESSWAHEPIGVWSTWSSAARDYRSFAAELLEQEGEDEHD